MEVDRQRFWPQLLPILNHISKASFISFDLEMSGITVHPRFGPSERKRKSTMQEQYEETKEAAERYQILQMGITCVEEDRERSIYIARPFNFNVSPLFLEDDRLEISRDITLSSSAVHFLIKNRFDMGAVFVEGNFYLSREEEDKARADYVQKQDRLTNVADIIVESEDEKTRAFVDKARATIDAWTKEVPRVMEFVTIGCYGGLNGFQRRLVHQLVRNEFHDYRTFSRSDYMVVEKKNLAEEAHRANKKQEAFDLGLAKQIGLRYIIEALTGRPKLDKIEPRWFCSSETGTPRLIDLSATKKEIGRLQKSLSKKRHIIVGHNLFTDLIFIYKTFIGTLPNTVEQFQQRIHSLFPHIIDTKYLATHGSGSMRVSSNLRDMCDSLKAQPWPLICLDVDHTSYAATGKDHEAGYDSWMTAQILVKLSAKVKATQPEENETDSNDDIAGYNSSSDYFTADESLEGDDGDHGAILNSPDRDMTRPPVLRQQLSNGSYSNPSKISSRNITPTKDTLKLPKPPKPTRTSSRFSTPTPFDLLQDEGDSDSSASNGSATHSRSPIIQGANLMDTDIDDFVQQRPLSPNYRNHKSENEKDFHPPQQSKSDSPTNPQKEVCAEWHERQLNPPPSPKQGCGDVQKFMPSFDDKRFWGSYRNKLRVFGTDTEICYLGN